MQKDSKKGVRGVRHSRAYHRHFEGYTEFLVARSNGKGTRIKRIYTGNYYRQDLFRLQRVLIRFLYLILFAGAVALYISSAILPLTGNSTWYVVLPEAFCLPFLFWIIIAFLFYMPAETDMTIADYRSSSQSLRKAALGAAISLGVTAIAALIFSLMHPFDEPTAELLCAAKYLACGLILFAINRIERKIKYLIIPSQNKVPENGFEIK
jgi:hypothetical protein